MPLHTWLQSADNPTHLPLPKARGNSCFVSANKEVAAVAAQGEKRKRGHYHHYDAKTHVKIAKLIASKWFITKTLKLMDVKLDY